MSKSTSWRALSMRRRAIWCLCGSKPVSSCSGSCPVWPCARRLDVFRIRRWPRLASLLMPHMGQLNWVQPGVFLVQADATRWRTSSDPAPFLKLVGPSRKRRSPARLSPPSSRSVRISTFWRPTSGCRTWCWATCGRRWRPVATANAISQARQRKLGALSTPPSRSQMRTPIWRFAVAALRGYRKRPPERETDTALCAHALSR